MNIKELIRPHLISLKPYSSARDEYTGKTGVFLDANENPFGSATSEAYNRYPDPLQKELKEKISGIKGVPAANIFLGNGSDEPIDLMMRAFCEPGNDNVIITPPTYGMYEVSAEINHVETRKAPLSADFQLREEEVLKMVDERTKLIFLCSPNNPTANRMNKAAVERILLSFRGIVIVDEAYIDFCDSPGFSGKLRDYPNLVILQTFSKAWGLAALRLGMAFASEEIIYFLNKIKPPYNINQATQQLALQAIENVEWKNQKVKEIIALREKLVDELGRIPKVEKIFPSEANFVLVKIQDAKSVFDSLIENKIIVRDRSRVTLCEGCLRITVGTEEENKALVAALEGKA